MPYTSAYPSHRTTFHEFVHDLARPVNRTVDGQFYNIGPKDEKQVRKQGGLMQGALVFVDPDPNKDLIFFHDPAEILLGKLSKEIGAVSIAGLGSSAIGAVGLARDVATATGVPVAAIASGVGLQDIPLEFLGGAWALPLADTCTTVCETLFPSLSAEGPIPRWLPFVESLDDVGAGPDLYCLKSLLRPTESGAPRLPKLRWVVGHSKGNMVISAALTELVKEHVNLDFKGVKIVLFSAVRPIPEIVGSPYQFLGACDNFGRLGSILSLKYTPVPGAWHHTNMTWKPPIFPFYPIDVKNLIEQVK